MFLSSILSICSSFISHANFAISKASGNNFFHFSVVDMCIVSSHPDILMFIGPASYCNKLSVSKSPNLSEYKKLLFIIIIWVYF